MQAQLSELQGDYPRALSISEEVYANLRQSVVNVLDNRNIIAQQVEVARLKHLSERSEEALADLKESKKQFPALAQIYLRELEIHSDLGNRDLAFESIGKIEALWKNADTNYFEYKKFVALKSELGAL